MRPAATPDPVRRRLLRAGLARTTLLPLAGGAGWFGAETASAQSSDYRALVCVFLYGGNDGLNTLPPTDADAYARYAAVRRDLAIARAQIMPLDTQLGLHPALAPLKAVWDEGRMAALLNVGPLARPLTLAQYQAWRDAGDATRVPDKLFSHSDQQILWQNAHAETVQWRGGWGGRLMEAVGGGPVMSFGGTSRFGSGRLSQELSLPGPGSRLQLEGYWSGREPDARRAALAAVLADGGNQVLASRYAALQRDAIAQGTTLGAILAQAPSNGAADAANPELSAAFGHLAGANGSGIARQLYQVAKFVKNRGTIGGNRHLFFVSHGGYDTHGDQLGTHAALLGQLGPALAAFWSALKAIGATEQVTLFTESDFGRTFKPNASGGTDHAWGNLQLVIGGQVRGGRSYGTYPSLQIGGPDDAAVNTWEQQGRWIPSIGVAQYADKLIDWFQPGIADKAAILPTLPAFAGAAADLGFLG